MNLRSTRVAVAYFSLLVVGILCSPARLACQTMQAKTNQMVEIPLASPRQYVHPLMDVSIECLLTGPSGESFSVGGFWDGGNIYRVRFAFPTAGVWTYTTVCTDTSNSGLHNIRGTVSVEKFSGPHPFSSKGFLRVSPNGRYLTHENGEPFFYLGDTAWELTWKSREPDMLSYIADRQKKGFTALQVVVMSHQFLYEYGVRNRNGEDFFLNGDRTRINPRYFDYLDRIVKAANDAGMVVALVPLWAGMMEYYTRGALTVEQSMSLARYVGARYAGSNVLWIVGGDNSYESVERIVFWSQFALALKKASGAHHLVTVHPKAWASSSDYFSKNDAWLDFHMYQSSHVAGGDFTWKAGLSGYYSNSGKPLLNGEATYEDIYNNLWLPGDTTRVQSFRIQAVDVRQSSYESLFSGALVGITYGANGIWQWDTPELPGTHMPRVPATEAQNFPGSLHMTILKQIMQKIPWYDAVPAQNLIADFRSQENYIPIIMTENRIVAYLPHHTAWVQLKMFPNSRTTEYFWIDPSTGDTSATQFVGPIPRFVPPGSDDWLLVIKNPSFAAQTIQRNDSTRFLGQNYPNPFNPTTVIRYYVPGDMRVRLSVYNTLGQEVTTLIDQEHMHGSYLVDFDGSQLSGGVYFYRFNSRNFSETRKFILIK
jgi:hypothetical protein